MNCIICWQAELVDGFTNIPLERDEMKLIVNAVPAQVCPNCGEPYLDEEVSAQLLRYAEEMSSMGIIEDVREYSMIVDENIP